MNTKLIAIIDGWMRRVRFFQGIQGAIWGIPAAFTIVVVLLIYTTLTKNVLKEELIDWTIYLILSGIVFGALSGYLWPVKVDKTLQKIDLSMNLDERISTAFELRNTAASTHLWKLQLQDALDIARTVEIKQAIQPKLSKSQLLILLALLTICLSFFYWADNIFVEAKQKRQQQQIIQTQIANIENLIEDIYSSPSLTSEQRDRLSEPLEKALVELQSAQTLEDTFTTLENTQQELRALNDPVVEQIIQAAENLTDNKVSSTGEYLDSAKENIASGNLIQAADALQNIDPFGMTASERAQLADELTELAEAIEASDSGLSEQLREAASSMQEGSIEDARQAIEQAAERLAEMAPQAAASETIRDLTTRLEASQQAVITAGQAIQAETLSADNQQPSNTENNAGQPGEGAGENTGSGDVQTGQEAGDDPIFQSNTIDVEREIDFQPITPTSLGIGGEQNVTIPSSNIEGERIVGSEEQSSADISYLSVPYLEVLTNYQNAAYKAIDSGEIPVQYRDLVRDYFSAIEP